MQTASLKGGFTDVSNELLNRVWATHTGLTAAQKLVWAYLADRANRDGVCWPSLEDIQASTEISRAGVFSALAELQRRGLVDKRWERDRQLFSLIMSPDSGLSSPNPGLPKSKIKTPESKSWTEESKFQTPPVQILDSSILEEPRSTEPSEEPSQNPQIARAGARETPNGSDDSSLRAWLAIEQGAGGPQKLGLGRDFGQVSGIWLPANKFQLWAANWRELRATTPPPTIADCEKLGRWIAAGGADGLTPWQVLAKAGGGPNVGAWIDRAAEWDGNGPPRRGAASKEHRGMPQPLLASNDDLSEVVARATKKGETNASRSDTDGSDTRNPFED